MADDVELDAALARLDPPPGGAAARLLVGLSGGLDSTVLLHALVRRRGVQGLRAIHVHHGLHPDAEAWTRHCERLCAALGVPLEVARVRVDASSALGPEGAARQARHAAFAAALAHGETLVLAHHRDDQAETILLRLLRASGSTGLAAMRVERAFGAHRLVRPLLTLGRDGLRAYAERHRLSWCEDPSNASIEADRNFLRLRVLPLLRERWPQASQALAASAARLREDADLLEQATHERLEALGGDRDWLPVAGLLALEPGWRARVLRAWTASKGYPPLPGTAPAAIATDVLHAPHDRAACYRWHGAQLRRWGDRLYALADAAVGDAAAWSLPWDGIGPLALPGGGEVSFVGGDDARLDADFGPCTVGSRRGGERILLPGRQHAHALKDRLREAVLPPWERTRLPLLRDGQGAVLAAGDAIVSAALADWCHGHGKQLRWWRAGAD